MTTNNETAVASFVADLPVETKQKIESELQDFVCRHVQQQHSRPIALVTSGGTVANLEVNAVRNLDNFSTGLRGAISVEEFLKRGYAVIHLWRKGSASPYARVLSQLLELEQANFALDLQSLGRLFEQPTKIVEAPSSNPETSCNDRGPALNHNLIGSSKLKEKLEERFTVMSEDRLLTIPFWSVEEYLAKLQMCTMALRPCGTTAILYLAAAVSDFYIPKSERSEHKISSSSKPTTNKIDNDNEENYGGLVLKLYPVPKVLGLLRTAWAPNAFVVSFKLETDRAVLREKAERAVNRYSCHMVIGNLLSTRHHQVWVLSPPTTITTSSEPSTTATTALTPLPVDQWPMQEISKAAEQENDALEEALIDFVVQSHSHHTSFTSSEIAQAVSK